MTAPASRLMRHPFLSRGAAGSMKPAQFPPQQPHAQLASRVSRRPPSVAGGPRGPSGGCFFPHFAPPSLTCGFVLANVKTTMFGLVPVEECGVQWGAVE